MAARLEFEPLLEKARLLYINDLAGMRGPLCFFVEHPGEHAQCVAVVTAVLRALPFAFGRCFALLIPMVTALPNETAFDFPLYLVHPAQVAYYAHGIFP